jgi:hypothetical protein
LPEFAIFQKMNTIDKIREKLGKYPDAKLKLKDNSITFFPDAEDGFKVGLAVQQNRFFVSFDGWHEEFEDESEAVKCFEFGLSEDCRLRVLQRGRMQYRWLLQSRVENEWKSDSEIGLIFFPFWLRKKERYLQNHLIKKT